jgi:hypothetical protein
MAGQCSVERCSLLGLTEAKPRYKLQPMTTTTTDPAHEPRAWLATYPDGSQTLVVHYPMVNRTTIATRPNNWATWGPPHDMEVAP